MFKQIITSNNKVIDVYDDLFTFNEKSIWFNFIKNSLFKINGSDGDLSYTQGGQIFSTFSMDDLSKFGLINSPGFETIKQKYSVLDRRIKQIRVNLSHASEDNLIHTDGNGTTILLYANLDWRVEWGGHTLFMDEDLKDAEYTCLYKPGRLVVFDSPIPHMILTPNKVAPIHRYSFVIQIE
jgi:hypothetical protein